MTHKDDRVIVMTSAHRDRINQELAKGRTLFEALMTLAKEKK